MKEKNYKNLEKRHFNSGLIGQLKTGGTSFISSDKEILNVCEHFYKNLHSSHEDAQNLYSSHKDTQQGGDSNFFFEDSTRQILDSDENEDCEGLLTKAECLQTVKNMEPDKHPAHMDFRLIYIKSYGMTYSITS